MPSRTNHPSVMKLSPIKILTIIATAVIIGGFIYFALNTNAFREKAVAKDIPDYPGSEVWNVSGSIDLYGTPSAYIYFYSEDPPHEVIEFYKKSLPEIGIEFVDEGKLYSGDGETGDVWANFEKVGYKIQLVSRFYRADDSGRDQNYYIHIVRGDWE